MIVPLKYFFGVTMVLGLGAGTKLVWIGNLVGWYLPGLLGTYYWFTVGSMKYMPMCLYIIGHQLTLSLGYY